ncbi:MAG TPA: protein kinase, partial [Phototrophicaceae bacterium]|nr:protein kinase [Phototrophicaceae bacterium]
EFQRRGKRIAYPSVVKIIRDMSAALDYAHQEGVVHRDVKPSNIMVMQDGHAVLTDFGLALSATEGTMGNTFGSVHYIAPEQAVSSRQASPRSDLYSLGVVLYEMMTGRVPFEDDSAMSVALKHISDPPPPPSYLNPDVSPQIEAVIMKSLDKDPVRRYQTGADFVRALTAAFASSNVLDTHDMMQDSQFKVPIGRSTVVPSSLPPAVNPTVNQGAAGNQNIKQIQNADTVTDSSKSSKLRVQMQQQLENARNATRPGALLRQPSRMMGIGIIFVLLMLAGIFFVMISSQNNNNPPTGTPEATQIAAINLTGSAVSIGEGTDGTATALAAGINDHATQIPTETASETITITVTSSPNVPPTLTATITSSPTQTSTATLTSTATETLTPLPPSETPTLANTPTPELESSGEPPLLLRYDGRSLIAYNRDTSENINISNLDFIGTDLDGESITFVSDDWGVDDDRLYLMRPKDCFQLWSPRFVQLPSDEFPADICAFRQGYLQINETFWINETADSTFKVQRNGRTLATCPTTNETSDAEIRCVVALK